MNVGPENAAVYNSVITDAIDIDAASEQLPAVDCAVVVFRAATANSGTITLSSVDPAVSLVGFTLAAGQQSPPLPLSNLNLLYAIASAANQNLEYIAMR